MGRIGRLAIIVATTWLPWCEPLVCRGQESALQSTMLPAEQRKDGATPADAAPAERKSKANVAPPRSLTDSDRASKRTVSIPPPRAWK